ncbi:TRAP transporter substrate-binding protein DctP [Cereibacter azotoformans]|uniref:TRAP dicarboxylate transporter-DctP subunit n=1 Tax=Cereibacter sphaeroides (strain ATCC 17025 / ATH 2.4.3) TaxID=349102 RepID=A4WST0_CERS5|nr:TRAP transporter substrate-binding protein DctP [Cereibacter azotoformans]ULB09745.1 TRAP transporter substrate-binding protein DctP [Cereibacter azotoformans]
MTGFTKWHKATPVAAAILLLAGPASAQDPVTWRMTHAFAETSTFYQLFALPFAERVAQLTDGQVVIQPYPAGVIAPSFEAYDAVLDGAADAVQSSAVNIVNRDPANALFSTFPGGMGPEALWQWMWYGGGRELLAEHRRETMDLHALPCGMGATELFAQSHKPLKTLADFQGVKFRTVGSFADVLTAIGAAPTVVPGDEVYTMLERGAIDAAEWGSPSENLKAGLHETAKYIIYPGVHTNAFFQEFAVRAELWDALSPELQGKVTAACELSSMDTLAAFDALDRKAWAELKQGNNEIVRLDDEVVERIREEGRKWIYARADEGDASGNPWVRKVAESYFAFYDDWIGNTSFRAVDHRAEPSAD